MTQINHEHPAAHEDEEIRNLTDECKELLLSLPKERAWTATYQYQYQGFWCPTPAVVQAVLTFQKHFKAKDSDIVVASPPKSGTTWLKAMTFAVVYRHRLDDMKSHPLLTSNSHNLVPFLELDLCMNNLAPDFSSKFPDEPRRLFGTHLPFASLGSIRESGCKIVYVCRNPFDTFVSLWHHISKARPKSLPPLSLDEAFDKFTKGKEGFGPSWAHILGYWEESLKRPQNVLFFKYEEMQEDVVSHLKRLADFFDCPFTADEESNGVIEDIAKLCSFEVMRNLEVNKTGMIVMDVESKNLFRKGEVGDWVNYFTPEMEEKMAKAIEKEFDGSGLTFKGIPVKLADPVKQN